ncbi:MAG: OmpH family outer membrane protein [Candidatus Sulfobium sp.]
MKKILLLVVIFGLVAGRCAYAENNVKLGVVDLMKALNESDAGKKAKAELESVIKSKQAVINEKGKAIEKLKAELDKQSSVLSPDAKKSKEDDLDRMMRDYQRMVSDSQSDVKKRESELTGGILKGLRAVIQQIGRKGGYTMIIEDAEGIVLYSRKSLDLTDEVIKQYNASHSATGK